MVKELGLPKIVVPDEFVVEGIIAKLPPLWRDFVTALKHKRVQMSILDLIVSLDIDENVLINKKRKLSPKIVDCVFLGYAHHSIVYRFLVIKSDIPDVHVDTFLESRDVTFFENIFSYKKIVWHV
jgi:hypothetical protein